jgi:hypothetical protein
MMGQKRVKTRHLNVRSLMRKLSCKLESGTTFKERSAWKMDRTIY